MSFAVTSFEEACTWVLQQAEQRAGWAVRLSNAYCVALADKDPGYRECLSEGVVFPDGTPVAWLLRARGNRRAERVRGPSLFERTLELSQGTATRHFLLGSTAATLDQLEAEIRRRYPNALVVGQYAPPFAPLDDGYIGECVEEVRKTHANLVWLGLGTPKQDFLAAAMAEHVGAPCVGVGAAFDFIAGASPQAPRIMQRTGTEWIFRLISEPRRLWRRYLFGNARFLLAAARTRRPQ